MTKKNNQSCQIALNIFKMSELNFKNQFNLLQTAISQRNNFRMVTLLINTIKETKEELRKTAKNILENPHPSTFSSIQKDSPTFSRNCRSLNMKSIAWITTDNSASLPHDYEMILVSVGSAAHTSLSLTDHRQHEQRSQHRRFRTTILKLNFYFSHHQHLPGYNLPSFCHKTAIHNHCHQNF